MMIMAINMVLALILNLLVLFLVEAVQRCSPKVIGQRDSDLLGLSPSQNRDLDLLDLSPFQTSPAGDQTHPHLVREAFFCDWNSCRFPWFIGECRFPDITPIKPYISVKDSDILHDDQHSRSSFGEGNGYKIQKIFWRLGRQIWDPGIVVLGRNLHNEKMMSVYFWVLEFDMKGFKIRDRGFGLSLDEESFAFYSLIQYLWYRTVNCRWYSWMRRWSSSEDGFSLWYADVLRVADNWISQSLFLMEESIFWILHRLSIDPDWEMANVIQQRKLVFKMGQDVKLPSTKTPPTTSSNFTSFAHIIVMSSFIYVCCFSFGTIS